MDDLRDPDSLALALARRKRRRHGFGRTSLWVVGVFLGIAAVTAGAGVAAVALFVHEPSSFVGCNLAGTPPRALGEKSYLYARDGSRLGAVPSARNRRPIALARMGRWLPAATVAIEDRRFWRRRSALDYEAIARAAIANLRAGRTVQGGSTIDQQLVRVRYLRNRQAVLSRKLKEACLAIQLAKRMPKRQILRGYLNGAFYGSHALGVDAAARTYFSRPPRRLTLAQAALIAGLPQAPTRFNPFRHPAKARSRRNEVLRALWTSGQISAARYSAAASRRLRLRPSSRYERIEEPPFFDAALRELVDRYGRQRARTGGLRVRTTLDPRLQKLARQSLDNWLRLPTDPAGALVAIDPATGAVRALAVRAPDRPLRFNLATQSRRQAGSTFKTFTLAAAIESGIPLDSVWHGPSSLAVDDRRCRDGDQAWVAHNFADEAEGTMTLLQATAHSVNTIFAQVALRAGLSHVVDVAHRMGIESPLEPVCSITLGPEGVSPLEMADAFATLAARGMHHPPALLERVTGRGGRRLPLEHTGERALSRDVADKVTYALAGVVRAGTGVAASIGRPAAGKTGTAEEFKDAWFCGFVPQLATCVWIGHAEAETPMAYVDGFAEVVGGSVPARIWHDFMAPAVSPMPVEALPTPDQARLAVPRRAH